MSSDAPERILRIAAVLERTGLTRSTLYRKIAEGSFPPQVKLSARCAGWYASAVNAWLVDPVGYHVDPHRPTLVRGAGSSGQLCLDAKRDRP